MKRSGLLVLAVGVGLAISTGCEPPAASVASTSAPPPPPIAGAGIEIAEFPVAGGESGELPAESPATPGESLVQLPAIEEREQPQPAPDVSAETTIAPAAADSKHVVRLSAGVALPQLLPEGTQIGVSVDYRVTGRLPPSARHVLVILSSEGEMAVPVELSEEGGTLQGFCPPSVRPEHKPFRARIDEQGPGSRLRMTISNTAELATSY